MNNDKSILFVALFVGFFALANEVSAETFYVSPGGSDNNPGTIEAPFKTIEKARNTIRTINSNMQEDITVYLRGGWYDLNSTIQFTSLDSGTNGKNIIYRNYPGEIAVISGGKKITGWELYDPTKNIWKANVSGTVSDTRHLFINYVRATRARTEPGTVASYQFSKRVDLGGYTTTNANMKNWGNKQDIEIVSNEQWKQFRCGVSNISGNTITVKQPCWDLAIKAAPAAAMNDVTSIENAYELLDTPGEWYLNKRTGQMFYKPRIGENMPTAVIIASNLETLLSANGSASNKLHNVQFQGLRFAYSGWTGPNKNLGFAQMYLDYYLSRYEDRPAPASDVFLYNEIPAGVDLKYVENVKFEGNRFVHMGGTGLKFGVGSKNNEVVGNVFKDISGTGVFFRGQFASNPGSQNLTTGNQVLNNYIEKIGAEYQGTAGIFLDGTRNSTVKNNELFDLPYSGIAMRNQDVDSGTYRRNNSIGNNRIDRPMQVLRDGGGIYSFGNQLGTVIYENVITGQLEEYGAVYLDNGSRYVELRHNVIFNNYRTAIIKGDTTGGDHYIHDNYWQNRGRIVKKYNKSPVCPNDCPLDIWEYREEYSEYVGGPNRFANNQTITSLSQAPAQILSNAGLTKAFMYLKGGDFTKPVVTINTKPALTSSQLSASFTFSANEPSEFLCSLNGGPFEICTSPKSYAKLSGTKQTFAVKAVDKSGNVSASTAANRYSWTVKTITASTTPPAIIPNTYIAPITTPTPTPIITPTPLPTPIVKPAPTPTPIITPAPIKIDGSLSTDKYISETVSSGSITSTPVSNSILGSQTMVVTTSYSLPILSTTLVSNSISLVK